MWYNILKVAPAETNERERSLIRYLVEHHKSYFSQIDPETATIQDMISTLEFFIGNPTGRSIIEMQQILHLLQTVNRTGELPKVTEDKGSIWAKDIGDWPDYSDMANAYYGGES